MSLSTTQTFVRPDVECIGDDSAFLQPLLVTIYFSGPVPQHLIREQIKPIKITVSVAEEYNKFMAPVIRAKVWSVYQSEPSEPAVPLPMPAEYYTGSDEINMDTCTQDFAIPFLPLPHTFDCTDPRQWDVLSKDIECWLIDEVQNSSLSIWTWGRDAFWLAFIGANPTFPGGRWSVWDPRIPLEGTFIEEWLGGDETESVCLEGSSDGDQNDDYHNTSSAATLPDYSSTLSYIWDLFSRHVALFYPQPLISAT